MLSFYFIKHFVAEHATTIYALITLGVFLEGEIVAVLGGIFAHLSSINIYLIILSVFIGCLLKSILGYSFGLYLNKNHSHRSIVKKTEARINYHLPNFTKKPFLSIFLSRFLVLGIYWFSIIYAGYKRIDMKTYIKAEIVSFIAWASVMISLGYFFSYTALSISRDIRNFLLLLVLFFIVFFIIEKIVALFIELFELEESKLD